MQRILRIIAGGVHHETNSFTPVPTRYDDFSIDRGIDRYRDDDDLLAPLDAIDLAPTFVAGAQPGGLVERSAYERLKSELLAAIGANLPADGLLLDLHGAMEVAEIGDGETDLIRAVRDLVGNQLPIAVSLDLHGNISPELVAQAQILTAYRTAPHRDARATRRRALALLVQAIEHGARPVSAIAKLPLRLAGEAAVTDVEPARSLYAQLPAYAAIPGLLDASIMIGCAWTDSPYAMVSAIVVAEGDGALAQRHAAALAESVWRERDAFGYSVEALDADAAIAAAVASDAAPFYISDSGDNVTAGAPGDSPYMLARLLAAGAADALVAGIADAPAVAACAAVGVGATLELAIGNTLNSQAGPPLHVRAIVERVTPGVDGAPATAVVQVAGVRVILTAGRQAFTERAAIAAAGIDLDSARIIVVKIGYLFPDLVAHAARAIMALTPGATTLRLETLPYRNTPRSPIA